MVENVNFIYFYLDENLYRLFEVRINNFNLLKVSFYMWILRCEKKYSCNDFFIYLD